MRAVPVLVALLALAEAVAPPTAAEAAGWTSGRWTTELRKYLFTDLDSAVPPVNFYEEGSSSTGNRIEVRFAAPLRSRLLPLLCHCFPRFAAQVQINFFRIINLDLSEGSLELKIWRRIRWHDPRLAWNASDWNGITDLVARPAHGSTMPQGILGLGALDHHLWIADTILYNSVDLTDIHMELGAAYISSDGTVLHSRPGRVKIACRFSGLIMFPHDTLTARSFQTQTALG